MGSHRVCTAFRTRRVVRPFLLLLLLLPLLACSETRTLTRTVPAPPRLAGSSVLVWKPEVYCYRETFGGAVELDEEATAAAQENVRSALEEELSGRGLQPVPPPQEPLDEALAREERQYFLLVEAVIAAIRSSGELPTRADKFEWSLGPGAAALGEGTRARYALFSAVWDVRVSVPRKLLIGRLGAYPNERPRGFGALLDLQTGEVVWYSSFSLKDQPTGELKKREAARSTVRVLLGGLPL